MDKEQIVAIALNVSEWARLLGVLKVCRDAVETEHIGHGLIAHMQESIAEQLNDALVPSSHRTKRKRVDK